MLRRFLLTGLLGVSCLSWQSVAHAANVFVPGNGARSLGRADAVVASGKDSDAVFHNPANLSRLRGFGIRLDASFSFQSASFKRMSERTGTDGLIEFDTIEKKKDPALIPMASIWYNIKNVGPGTLTLALFGYGPHGRSGYEYPEKPGNCKGPTDPEKDGDAFICEPMAEPGPQRLSLIWTRSPMLYTGLGVGYGWNLMKDFGIHIGATFKATYLRANQRLGLIAASSLYRPSVKKLNSSSGEILMEVLAEGFYFTGDIGVTLDLPYGLKFGASFLVPSEANINGSLRVEVNKLFGNLAKIRGKDIRLVVPFPGILRTGLAWSGHGLTVEISFVMELWGQIQQSMDVYPQGISIEFGGSGTELEKIELPQILRDSLSIRFGAEYNFLKMFYARLGFLWEGGATTEDRINVSTVDYPDKIGFSAGFSVDIPVIGAQLDLSALYFIPREFEITNSALRPADVSPENLKAKDPITSVSNGTYNFGVMVLSVGLRGNWGK